MPSKHLKFGGSTASRLLACPASFMLQQPPKSETGSYAAIEGTLLHDLAEMIIGKAIKERSLTRDFVTQQVDDLFHTRAPSLDGVELTPELANDKLLPALYEAVDLLKDADVILLEPFVEIIEDIAGGSIDVLYKRGTTLGVLDYKFGFNLVTAQHNAQLQFYALATLCTDEAMEKLDVFADEITDLELSICQPKPDRDAPTLDTWHTPVDILDRFETRLRASIELVDTTSDDEIALHTYSGSHCRWCPVHPICPKLTGEARKALMLDLTQTKQLSQAMLLAEQLEPWIKAVKSLTHKQLELGNNISGFKLVKKRAIRAWKSASEADIIKAVGRKLKRAEIYKPQELISPTQLTKKLVDNGISSDIIEPFIEKKSSGTTLAKESDKRPAVPALGALEEI